jgi:hypothetical protein
MGITGHYQGNFAENRDQLDYPSAISLLIQEANASDVFADNRGFLAREQGHIRAITGNFYN